MKLWEIFVRDENNDLVQIIQNVQPSELQRLVEEEAQKSPSYTFDCFPEDSEVKWMSGLPIQEE